VIKGGGDIRRVTGALTEAAVLCAKPLVDDIELLPRDTTVSKGESRCDRFLVERGNSFDALRRRCGVDEVEDTGDWTIGDNDPNF
jgi:hypothetical protein